MNRWIEWLVSHKLLAAIIVVISLVVLAGAYGSWSQWQENRTLTKEMEDSKQAAADLLQQEKANSEAWKLSLQATSRELQRMQKRNQELSSQMDAISRRREDRRAPTSEDELFLRFSKALEALK